eukprot:PhM_4_TR10347/c0_g1_i1/m.35688/K13783/SLC37A1_2; MFS transporter, OPA family, solute carrier family 37 (glycerol-3-phosphate transporter), member 1/2
MGGTFENIRLTRVLIPTYVAYLVCVLGRKPTSIARSEMSDVVSPYIFGWVDTSFLMMYSVGQLLFVHFQHMSNIPVRTVLGVTLLGSATCVYLFPQSTSAWHVIVLWGIYGLLQSVSWPVCMGIVTPWIEHSERGSIMGVWGSCQAVGGIAGGFISAYLLGHLGWQMTFTCDAAVMGLAAVGVLLVVIDHPNRLGVVAPSQSAKGMSLHHLLHNTELSSSGEVVASISPAHAETPTRKAPPTMWHILSIPDSGVVAIAASLFFQKLARYSLMLWLPYVLTRELGYDAVVAGYTATAFDLGGVIGSVAGGAFSDWYAQGQRRVTSTMLILVMALASLVGFALMKTVMQSTVFVCCVLTGLIGLFLFSADTLMTGAVVQDVAERCGMPEHTSSFSAVVGGVGSLGAVLQGCATTFVASHFGWGAVLVSICLYILCGGLCMVLPVKKYECGISTKAHLSASSCVGYQTI